MPNLAITIFESWQGTYHLSCAHMVPTEVPRDDRYRRERRFEAIESKSRNVAIHVTGSNVQFQEADFEGFHRLSLRVRSPAR